jgi:hypothetical protein
VRDQHQGAAGATLAHQGTHLAHLLGLPLGAAVQIAQRWPHLGEPPGQPRRLQAAAPRARQQPVHRDAARPERVAQPSRVGAAGVGQVALAGAVVQAHAGRVAHAGRGDGVADEDDLAARLEESPEGLVGAGRRGQTEEGERQREGYGAEGQPPQHDRGLG